MPRVEKKVVPPEAASLSAEEGEQSAPPSAGGKRRKILVTRVKTPMTEGRFVSSDAHSLFSKISGLPFIEERGIVLDKGQWSRKYSEIINKIGWVRMCEPRREAIYSWVYEFYANARFLPDGKTMVRGKEVNYSVEALNACFGLTTPEIDVLDAAVDNLKKEDVQVLLCGTSALDWASIQKKTLKATCLTREAKMWQLFLNSSVMPTKNHSQVSMEKAIIIFCILSGTKINISTVIFRQLLAKIQSSEPKILWFPTLITRLCRIAGVKKEESDLITTVRHHITKAVIFRSIKTPTEQAQEIPTPATEVEEEVDEFEEMFSDPEPKTPPQPPAPPVDILQDNPFKDLDGIVEQLEHIKLYQRYHHLYINAKLEAAKKKRELLLKRAKVVVEAEINPWEGRFDEEGYLLNSDGERLDPSWEPDEMNSEEE